MKKETASQDMYKWLVEIICEISGLEHGDLVEDASLLALGLDSLMIVRIGRVLERECGVHIPIRQFYDELHEMRALCDFLAKEGCDVRTKTASVVSPGKEAVAAPEFRRNSSRAGQSENVSATLHEVMSAHLRIMRKYLDRFQGGLPESVGSDSVRGTSRHASTQDTGSLDVDLFADDQFELRRRFSGMDLDKESLTDEQVAFVTELGIRMEARLGGSKQDTAHVRSFLADWKHCLQFKQSLKEMKFSLVCSRADGAYIWDVDGHRYIDLAMGMGVHFFGHAPPNICRALHAQVDQNLALGPQTLLAGEVAERILTLTKLERVALSITGSSAVMFALRIARAFRRRRKVVLFSGAYHGVSSDVLGASGPDGTVALSAGVPEAMVQDLVILDYGVEESLDYIREHADEIAAVLVEPVQSRRPGFQPQRFLRRLRRVTEEPRVVLIFDEMITGFRVHPGGAQAWFGVQADLATYGKIVGGGMPMSAIAGRRMLLDYIDGGDWCYGDASSPNADTIFTGGTYNRHPIALAASKAALDYMISEGPALQVRVSRRTEELVDRLNVYFEQEAVPIRCEYFASQFRFDAPQFPFELELFFYLLLERGIYTWEQRVCCLSDAHSAQDVEQIIEAVRDAVVTLRKGGFSFRSDGLRRRFFPMSSVQRRLFALNQREGAEFTYHLIGIWTVVGEIDPIQLEEAIHDVICRHEGLRTAFVAVDGVLLQKIVDEPRFSLEFHDAGDRVGEEVLDGFVKPFNLACPPLVRVALSEAVNGTTYLLLDAHHLAVDGLSMNVVMREVAQRYEGLTLATVQYQCRHVHAAFDRLKTTDVWKAQRAFWAEQLGGELPELSLPTDYPRPAQFDFQGERAVLRVEAAEVAQLRQRASESHSSLYMVLLTACTTLLYRLTGQEDFVLGLPVSGRPEDGYDEVVGMFVNTILLRIGVRGEDRLADVLANVRSRSLDAYEHQMLPFEELVHILGSKNRSDRNILFDVMFSYENADDRRIKNSAFELDTVAQFEGAGMFDLSFDVIEETGALTIHCAYATSLFHRQTIERWLEFFRHILASVGRDMSKQVKDVDILSSSELDVLLAWGQDRLPPYKGPGTLIEGWMAQVAVHPDRPAVSTPTSTLTYAQLAERVEGLAQFLHDEVAIQPNDCVGVWLDGHELFLVSVLAIMRVGATYVPFAVDVPEGRVLALSERAGCSAMLTDRMASHPNLRVLSPDVFPSGRVECSVPEPTSSSLAYLLYTSGSTGEPKGVQVEHGAICRNVSWRVDAYSLCPEDVNLQMPSSAFDASILDIFSTLFSGGHLVLLPLSARRTLGAVRDAIQRWGVTHVLLTPGLYRVWLTQIAPELTGLRSLSLAGDKLPLALVQTHFELLPHVPLWNEYGPTENSVVSTALEWREVCECVTIGRPVRDTQVLLLDSDGQFCPIGVWGEICLSGATLARGYDGLPEETAKRFVPHVLESGRTMYRTGDIGRWLPSGEIEFFGRRDLQVKLNGYRIELEEVESALRQLATVRDAVAAVTRDSEGRRVLAAWIVPEGQIEEDSVRVDLGAYLPGWMIPTHIETLDVVPLNTNGKVVRSGLKLGVGAAERSRTQFLQPTTARETVLMEVCRDVLNDSTIGLNDDYFSVGGDSIQAILLVSRLYQAGWALDMNEFFRRPRLVDVAECMCPVEGGVEWVQSDRRLPSPIQVWWMKSVVAPLPSFNHAAWIDGAADVTIDEVTTLVQASCEAHPTLRTALASQGTGWELIELADDKAWAMEVHDAESWTLEQDDVFSAETQDRLDLMKGPVARADLLVRSSGNRLLLTFHHLIMDAVSWQILLREWNMALAQIRKGTPSTIPQEGCSFFAWTEQLHGADVRDRATEQRTYWLHRLKMASCMQFREVGSSTLPGRRVLRRVVQAEVADVLLGSGHHAYATHGDDLLLAAFAQALRSICRSDDLGFIVERHGRNGFGLQADLSSTVGWFTSLFPVGLALDSAVDWESAVWVVKEALHRVPDQGLGFGILQSLHCDDAICSYAMPPVTFNYLGNMKGLPEHQLGLRISSTEVPNQHPDSAAFVPPLEYVCYVDEDGLQVKVSHDRAVVADDLVDQLEAAMHKNLAALADHCGAAKTTMRTACDFAYDALSLTAYRTLLRRLNLCPGGLEDIWPLTPMQSGLLLETLRDPTSDAYFEQMSFRLSGGVDGDRLASAFEAIVERHAALRAAFVRVKGDTYVQGIVQSCLLSVSVSDLSMLADDEREHRIEDFKKQDRRVPFHVDVPPLMRVHLFDCGCGQFHVVWSHHHLLMDGWCVGILYEDLMQAYVHAGEGQPHLEPGPSLRPYFAWLNRQKQTDAERFWCTYLEGAPCPSRIPGAVGDGNISHTYEDREYCFVLPPDTTDAMRTWTSGRRATLSSFLRLAWGVLLARTSNQTDVVFGSIVSGRPPDIVGIDAMVGLFINAIPVRFSMCADTTAETALDALQEQANDMRSYEWLPLSDLQDAVACRELFDHLVVLENYPMDEGLRAGELETAGRPVLSHVQGFERTHYGLTLVAVPGEGLNVTLMYDGNRFTEQRVRQMADHFTALIHAILAAPTRPLKEVPFITDAELNWLSETWNDTSAAYPTADTIVSLFDRQAERAPTARALTCGEREMDYGWLADRVSRVAQSLVKRDGFAQGERVALWLPRDERMVVGMLGVLKAGGAYVPLDPIYPEERLRTIVIDARPALLLTSRDMPVLCFPKVDSILLENLPDDVASGPYPLIKPDDCAYVMYTSGSTGMPKGCMISHRNVVRLMVNERHDFDFSAADVWVVAHSFCFDFSVWELYGALLYGARVVIPTYDEVRDTRRFVDLVVREQVTILNQTPAAFYPFAHEMIRRGDPSLVRQLRMVIFGGDGLDPSQLVVWLDQVPLDQVALINMYGITETTVHVSFHRITTKEVYAGTGVSVVGRPLPETEIWVMDAMGNVLPPGLVGELYIGGSGVGLGYWGRDDLTRERFVPHPISQHKLVYRSGDLGCIQRNGQLEYHGREDGQVQVRGFRVETGEIVQALLRHDAVDQAVVVGVDDSAGCVALAAYVVGSETPSLRSDLDPMLPEYMVPSTITWVDVIPLTHNGKVDRKALPAPRGEDISVTSTEPQSPLEQNLVDTWKKVLGIVDVGVNNNFFNLGGHSLKAVRLAAALEEQHGILLSMADIFKFPTIAEQAAHIESTRNQEVEMADLDSLLDEVSENELLDALNALEKDS